MTSVQAAAANLLELLGDWVVNCDLWDRHNSRVADNGYRGATEERDVRDDLQLNYTKPLMEKCDQLNFKYVDLMQMIPPAFRTNSRKRAEMLENITKWAKKEYGI